MPGRIIDVRTALKQGQELFEKAGITAPRLSAEVLLAHAIGCDRSWLFGHSDEELREVWWIHYGRYLHERLQGKPTQYITGKQEFYGRDFRVTPDVLIPRPETEHVVEAVLKRAGTAQTGATRILDIGTGSGAIAITLALEMKARVWATDISEAAVRVAQENARRLGAGVEFFACDLADAVRGDEFDVVVSNPPYIPRSDASTIQREVRDFEPEVALYGGADGYEVYRRLIPEAGRLLRPGGWLAMELSFQAAPVVRAMMSEWREVELFIDYAHWARVIVGRRG